MSELTWSPKVSLPELARRWGWPQDRLYRLVQTKQIPHLKIGRGYFFEEALLEPWLAERRQGPGSTDLAEEIRREREEAQECRRLGLDPERLRFS